VGRYFWISNPWGKIDDFWSRELATKISASNSKENGSNFAIIRALKLQIGSQNFWHQVLGPKNHRFHPEGLKPKKNCPTLSNYLPKIPPFQKTVKFNFLFPKDEKFHF
jgi:hypothetical protein